LVTCRNITQPSVPSWLLLSCWLLANYQLLITQSDKSNTTLRQFTGTTVTALCIRFTLSCLLDTGVAGLNPAGSMNVCLRLYFMYPLQVPSFRSVLPDTGKQHSAIPWRWGKCAVFARRSEWNEHAELLNGEENIHLIDKE